MKIAIIGSGISGLTTAFYLKKELKDVDITIFEKDISIGGKMKSDYIDGFIFEEGSNGFLSNKPDTLDLVKDCGCEDILMPSNDNARIRYIYKESLELLPESLGSFLNTPLLSLSGKLRVACEFFIPPKKSDEDETLQSFGYRRVGKEMTDTFLDPMVAGIFASTPDKISVKAAFPAVVALEKEYGGLFKGMMKKRKKEAGPGGILMSFKGGVSTFIDRLAKSIKCEILTDSAVISIKKEDNKYRVNTKSKTLLFDKVVLSLPAFEAANILKNIDEDICEKLNDIEYSPISVVGLGYENLNHPLNGFGLLCTTSSKKNILGVLWDSSIFEDRAKDNYKSLRVMIGGQRDPSKALLREDELVKLAIDGVKETMGVEQKPLVTFVAKHEKGIPNYKIGHLKIVEEIFSKIENHKGLYLNSNAYYGVGLNDCVKNSKTCAKKIVKELTFS